MGVGCSSPPGSFQINFPTFFFIFQFFFDISSLSRTPLRLWLTPSETIFNYDFVSGQTKPRQPRRSESLAQMESLGPTCPQLVFHLFHLSPGLLLAQGEVFWGQRRSLLVFMVRSFFIPA